MNTSTNITEEFELYREMLNRQNQSPDCTDAQREANAHRLKMLSLLMQERPEYTPSRTFDVIAERIKNPEFTFSPNSLLDN